MPITKIAYDQFTFIDRTFVDGAPTIGFVGYMEKPLGTPSVALGTRVIGSYVYSVPLDSGSLYKNTVTPAGVGTLETYAITGATLEALLEEHFPPNGWYFELSDMTAMDEWNTFVGVP